MSQPALIVSPRESASTPKAAVPSATIATQMSAGITLFIGSSRTGGLAADGDRREFLDERGLLRVVRRAVVPEDLVEPDGWLAIDVGVAPRIPRQVRLRLALHQAPVDGADAVLLEDRQRAGERAPVAARHVLGADERPLVALQLPDPRLELRRRVVAVERDDVGKRELHAIDRGQLGELRPVPTAPHTRRQRLRGIGLLRPGVYLREQRQHEFALVLRL